MSAYVAEIALRATSDMGDAKRDLDETNSLISRLKSTAGGVGGAFAMFGLASNGVREMKNTILDAAEALGITFNANLQQSRVAFGQFLGGAEQADLYLKDLMKMAAATPFEFPDLVRGAQRMMGLGVNAKQVIPLLTDIGNVVAAFGGSSRNIDLVNLALSQIISRSKVGAQEMNQLANQQIPAWSILAKAMGITIGKAQEMARTGQISADVFIQAFHKFATQPGIGDMMEVQSKTLIGTLSTIKDNLQIFGGSAFKPLFDRVAELSLKIADFTKSDDFGLWTARIAGYSEVVMRALGILVEGFGSALGSILTIVVSIGRLIYQALSYLNPFAKHSPSLVAQVTEGTAVIAAAYSGLAANVVPSLDRVKRAMADLESAVSDGMKRAAAVTDAETAKTVALLGKDAPAAYFAARDAMRELEGQAKALADQIKQAERDLRPFEQAVKDQEAALQGAKDALAQQVEALAPYELAVTQTTRATERAQDALDQAQAGLRSFGDAVDLAKDRVDGAQSALDKASVGLRTYRDALDQAKDSLQTAQDALDQAKAGIQSFSDAVDNAKAALDGAQAALDQQESALQGYRDAVDQAKAALDDQTEALNRAERALRPYEQALRGAQDAERQAQRALDEARAGLAPFAAALDAAKDRLDVANEAFQQASSVANGYKDQLAEAQQALQNFVNAPLEGTKRFKDAIFANDQAVAKLQLRLNTLKLNRGSEYSIRALERQIERLQAKGQNIQLNQQLELGPLQRQLEELNNTQKEMTFEEAVQGAIAARKQIDELKDKLAEANLQVALAAQAQKNAKGAVDLATAAYKAQERALRPLEDALNAAKLATQQASDALADAKAALDPLRDSVQDARDRVDDATRALKDQESQLKPYKDAVDAAQRSVDDATRAYKDQERGLKPYTDAVDAAQQSVDAASRAYRDQERALTPLKDALRDAKDAQEDATRALTDQERALRPLKDALTEARDAQDQATRALRDQKDLLVPYNAAVDTAQKNLDKATRALKDQKDAIDPLKQSYSDLTEQMGEYQRRLDEITSAAQEAATAAKTGKEKNEITGAGVGEAIPGIPTQEIGAQAGTDFSKITDQIVKDAQGSLDTLKQSVLDITGPLGDIAKTFQSWADAFAPVKAGIDDLSSKLTPLIDPVVKIGAAFLAWKLGMVGLDIVIGLVTGAAAALTSPLGLLVSTVALLAMAWSQDWGGIREIVLPILEDLRVAFQENLQPALDAVGRAFTDLKTTFDRSGIAGVWLELTNGATSLNPVLAGLQQVFKDLKPILEDLRVAFQENLQPALDAVGRAFTDLKTTFDTSGIAGVWLELTNGATALNPVLAGLQQVFKDLEPILQFAGTLWQEIQDQLARISAEAAPRLQEAWDKLQPSFAKIQEILERLKPLLDVIGFVIGAVVVVAIGALIGVLDGLLNALPGLSETFTAVVSTISDMLDSLGTNLANIFQFIYDLINGNWSKLWDDAVAIVRDFLRTAAIVFGDIFNVIKGVLDTIIGAVGGFIQGILDFFIGLAEDLVGHSIIPDMMDAIQRAWSGMIDTVKGWIDAFVTKVVGFFTDLGTRAGTAISDFVTAGLKAWDDFTTQAGTKISGFITSITGAFDQFKTDLGTKAGEIAQAIIAGLKWLIDEGPKQLNQWITDLFTGAVTTAKTFLGIKSPSTIFGDIGENLVKGIIQGIQNKWNDLIQKVKDLAQALPQPIKDILGIKSPSEEFTNLSEMMLKGLTVGVDENREATLNAMRDLAQAVLAVANDLMLQTADSFRTGMALTLQQITDAAEPIRTAWQALFGPATIEGSLMWLMFGRQDTALFTYWENALRGSLNWLRLEVWQGAFLTLKEYVLLWLGRVKEALAVEAEKTGKAMDQGIAKGITDNKQIVIDALKSVIDEAMASAASSIERGSPSKRTARELGMPMGQGIGLGLDNATQGAVNSMKGLISRVIHAGSAGAQGISTVLGQLTTQSNAITAPTLTGPALMPVAVGASGGVKGGDTQVTIHVYGLQGDIRSPHTWDGMVADAVSKSVQQQRIIKHPNDPDFGARR